ncbi:LADA_0H18294g1_1 [Lachancea dasiensis]|uniref:Nuclear pore complex protein Nup85 n=1 Tax=Lachancea dasiensis TaxID=1072105 RepID=A0A1G4K5Y8_9SACH|nr:LADA_0H18294g1_1 [Lachancea dasiensis]
MAMPGWNQEKDMLMDVDGLDFFKDSREDVNQEDTRMLEEPTIDDISGAPETQFDGEQPIRESLSEFKSCGFALKFQMAPASSRSLGYISTRKGNATLTNGGNHSDINSDLYSPLFHRLDSSDDYKQFVLTCFEIYKNLDEDRVFSIPTMGLVSQTSRKEHVEAVNLAMEALIDEVDSFIATQSIVRASELGDCLAILNCIQAFFFTTASATDQTGGLARQLTHWINRADGEPSELVVDQVFRQGPAKKVYETSSFWKLVNQLLLRGLFDQAIGVLEKSNIFKDLETTCELTFSVLTDVVLLLKQYPSSNGEEYREWKAASLQLSQYYCESSSEVDAELRNMICDMVLLISGTQAKILQYSSYWYEAFCGLFMFYIPTLELSEEYLQLSLKAHPLDVCSTWEQACAEIIRGKIYAVLPMIESLDSCIAAFFAAFCEAQGLLESGNSLVERQGGYEGIEGDLFSSNNSMASFLLHGFALELCSFDDKHLWSVAIGILAMTPSPNGSAVRVAVAELLPHFPFQSNDDVEWLLTLCAKWRLPEVAKTIYRILGNNFISENNVIEAMTNFSKAGEFEWVKHYSWMIFEASALQGAPLEDEIIDAIVSKKAHAEIPKEILEAVLTDAMKQALSPYAVLYQLYQQLGQKDLNNALENLLNLLEFPYLPKHYLALLAANLLYPVFLCEGSRQIPEDKIIRLIKAIDRFENDDSKSIAMYAALKEKPGNDELPEQLSDFVKRVRQRLNLKICEEYIT